MQLDAGDRLVVAGPSGSGKSVLLRALAKLDAIDEGQVLWRGSGVEDQTTPAYRSHVVYLHQRPAFPERSVIANLQMPFRLAVHADRRFSRERVVPWLQKLGRDAGFLERSTSDLSGGERQIVALLRVLQLDPSILLLDEPTASADARTAASVEELTRAWLDESPERALLWVTHDASQASRIGDRELLLDGGRTL